MTTGRINQVTALSPGSARSRVARPTSPPEGGECCSYRSVRASAGAEACDGFLSSPSDRTSGLANDSETTSLVARASRRPDHHASTTRPSRSSGHAGPGTRFGYIYALRIDTSFPSLPACARMRRGPSPLSSGNHWWAQANAARAPPRHTPAYAPCHSSRYSQVQSAPWFQRTGAQDASNSSHFITCFPY